MNKTELVSAMAEKMNMSIKTADECYKAFAETVINAMKKGDKISLIGFGTFDISERAAREGINPLTKEKIKIKASKNVRFKAGKAFKDAIQ